MVAKKPRSSANRSEEHISSALQVERITNLVALLLVKGEAQSEKIRILSAVGYTAPEIARLLDTTANSVNVALHRIRKKKG